MGQPVSYTVTRKHTQIPCEDNHGSYITHYMERLLSGNASSLVLFTLLSQVNAGQVTLPKITTCPWEKPLPIGV